MSDSEAITKPYSGKKTKYIEAHGKRLTLNEWAKEIGVCRSTIEKRLKEYSPEKALSAGFRGLKVSGQKAIIQSTKQGEFVAEFVSISEAGRMTDIDFRLISAVLNGKQNTTGGFTWSYK